MKHNLHRMMVTAIVLIMGVVCFQNSLYSGTWNLNVRQTDTVDYCSSNRNIIIEFVLDADVYFADSIYGFDIEFEYDTKSLTLFQNLEAGTLFGRVESGGQSGIKIVDFSQPGLVYISFANIISRPIAGSRVLTRIAGQIKGDCKDSSYIVIRSFEADYEFSKRHFFNATYYPVGYKVELNERKSAKQPIQYSLNKGNSRIDTLLKTISFANTINHNDVNRIKQMITKVVVDTSVTKYVDSIYVLKVSDNIELQQTQTLDNTYIFDYQLNKGSKEEQIYYSIVLSKMIENIDSLNLFFRVETNEVSTCTCTMLTKTDSLEYIWLKEKDSVPPSSIIDSEDTEEPWVNVSRNQDKLVVYKIYPLNLGIKIYNVHGELVEVNEQLSHTEILQSHPSGVYIMIVNIHSDDNLHKSRFQIIKIYK
jgi:hypothetical protein